MIKNVGFRPQKIQKPCKYSCFKTSGERNTGIIDSIYTDIEESKGNIR